MKHIILCFAFAAILTAGCGGKESGSTPFLGFDTTGSPVGGGSDPGTGGSDPGTGTPFPYDDEIPGWKIKTVQAVSKASVCIFAVTTDSEHNLYYTGWFDADHDSDGVDFNPGPESDIRTKGGAFVTRINADGTYGWTRVFASGAMPVAIAADSLKNIYIAGTFQGTVNFSENGNDTRTAIGANDGFVTKLNPAGDCEWTYTYGGDNPSGNWEWVRSVVIDPSGNVYITGNFYGTADFDYGPGTDIIASATEPAGPWTYTNGYITKINADGTYCWTRNIGANTVYADNGYIWGDAYGYSLAFDSKGNLYAAGQFDGQVDFDPYGGNDDKLSEYGLDIFVSKYGTGGEYLWTKAMGSVTGHCFARSVAVDKSDNVFVAGGFYGTVDFDNGPDSDIKSSESGYSGFIMKLLPEGGYGWAQTISSCQLMAVAADSAGGVYAIGNCYSKMYSGDPAVISDMNKYAPGMFIVKYSGTGNYDGLSMFPIVERIFPFIEGNMINALHLDGSDTLFAAGDFVDKIDFDPNGGGALKVPYEKNHGCGFIRRIVSADWQQ